MSSNIQDTILFLTCARSILCSLIRDSMKLTKENKTKLLEYIVQEATDYEILHLIIREKPAPIRQDFKDEFILYEYMNNIIGTVTKGVSQLKDTKGSFLSAIPLSFLDLSTKKEDIQWYINASNISEGGY